MTDLARDISVGTTRGLEMATARAEAREVAIAAVVGAVVVEGAMAVAEDAVDPRTQIESDQGGGSGRPLFRVGVRRSLPAR